MKNQKKKNKNAVKSKNQNWPSITEVVKESLEDVGKVIDNKQTMREFNKLVYEEPKEYSSEDIIRLRKHRMKMSQAVFSHICNVKLSTLQKWEIGARKPTPPVNRLFQLIEKDALSLIER